MNLAYETLIEATQSTPQWCVCLQHYYYLRGSVTRITSKIFHFCKNNNASVMKLKKRSDIILLTTGTQALNLKNSAGTFQVLPFWLEKSSLKWITVWCKYFTWCLSLNVLGAFLIWAIALWHGFSPALLKIAEKALWYCLFKAIWPSSLPFELHIFNLRLPFHFLIDFSSLFLFSAIQLFYSVRNMFELYSNVVPTYHQEHLVSKSSLNH